MHGIVSHEFSALVSDWFTSSYPSPSPIQDAAWPLIQRGEHVLITAPTGSGKTLTAFLWAIDSFITGRCESGATRVLYVSPLKALNNDIERNLTTPIDGIRRLAEQREIHIAPVRVAVRSGDTPSGERSQMVRNPPEILITTPESLNLILSSPRAREMLATVETVILDEIHAVIGTKRGTHLLTAVERLVLLAGEFQRIAISATVRPLERVASFVAGRRPLGPLGLDTAYEPRTVIPVQVPDTKRIQITLDFPDTDQPEEQPGFWPHLRRELRRIIDGNRSTLIFVNSRRHAEKITLLLNEGEEEPIAYSHHGSLSRELRQFVESSLKAGQLRAIVATNSLELGIDIGALETVVLVGTPPEVRSGLQRAGRAGHQVNAISTSFFFPLHGRDLIDAAVMTELMSKREIEETVPVSGPLDVLAQLIVAMAVVDSWNLDALFAAVRMCTAYEKLTRTAFDLVVDMVAGRYAETSLRELTARVVVDRVRGVLSAAPSARLTLYSSGGTIPDRGYFALRTPEGSRIGELDEEFVWERRIGETFILGSQSWTIESITSRDVVVIPARAGAPVVPFWRGLLQGRDPLFARRVLEWLEQCESADPGDPPLPDRDQVVISRSFSDALGNELKQQRAATGVALPHRHHVVIERFPTTTGDGLADGATTVVIHTLWGARVNAPLAIALRALVEQDDGVDLNFFPTDDSIIVTLEDPSIPSDFLAPDRCERLSGRGELARLLRSRLEGSNLFGALFRENAGRALLLPKGGFGKRTPLWLTRQRSKRLVESIQNYPDFPIMLETWRSCVEDVFALEPLRDYLLEIVSGETVVSHCETRAPSPFACEVVWQNTNVVMYADDSRPGAAGSTLAESALNEVLHNKALRPQFSRDLITTIEQRVQRVAAGYAPSGPAEIAAWLEERVVLGVQELGRLRDAVVRDHGETAWSLDGQTHRFFWILANNCPLIAAVGRPQLLAALYRQAPAVRVDAGDAWETPPPEPVFAKAASVGDIHALRSGGGTGVESADPPTPADSLAEILRFYGPRREEFYELELGVDKLVLRSALTDLLEDDRVVRGLLSEQATQEEICDADVLEYLLRARRRNARNSAEPVDPTALVPFWAKRTGIKPIGISGKEGLPQDGADRLVNVLDVLFAYPAPGSVWESDLLPVRLPEYQPLLLDGLLAQSPLRWMGATSHRVLFCLPDDVEFLAQEPFSTAARRLSDSGPLTLSQYCERAGISSEQASKELWDAVWSGEVSNTGFEAMRTGIRSRFVPAAVRGQRAASQTGRRLRRSEWAATRPGTGSWFALRPDSSPDSSRDDAAGSPDPLVSMEQNKELARLLLSRYGVLYRTLLDRELPSVQWSNIFGALRIMELSGEIQSGLFLRGLPAPQFALPTFSKQIDEASRSREIFWINANDPASPCGVIPAPSEREFPVRVAGSHLVFRGKDLVLVSRRQARELTIYALPNDPQLELFLEPLRVMLTRRVDPLPRVSVETVNGAAVRESEFAQALLNAGFRNEFRSFVLSASYR